MVAAAVEAGVELFSLTDHDSVEGVAEAAGAAAASGLGFVTGVEISVLDDAAADIHMCGYLIDVDNEALLRQLEQSRGDREHRADRIADRLEELGYAVDRAHLQERVASGKTVGRPHLAEAVVHHPANAERLRAEGLTEPTPFLVAYLIEGTPAFLPREAPGAERAIDLIHGAGGLAVWAHPFWDIEGDDGVVATLDRFVALGLDGVEVFYPSHDEYQTRFLVERCKERGLITTGSSDYHGPGHRQFNHFHAFETYGLPVDLGPLAAQLTNP